MVRLGQHPAQGMFAAALLAPALLALAGCGHSAPPTQPLTEAQSAALTPADPHLAELYGASCKACHTVRASTAPLTGDRTLWDARWSKGLTRCSPAPSRARARCPPAASALPAHPTISRR
jgi:cytochrome c5